MKRADPFGRFWRRLLPTGRANARASAHQRDLGGSPWRAPDIDRFGETLPYLAMTDEGFMALEGAKPGRFEGIGFTIELSPQTGVTDDLQKTLTTLAGVPFPEGTTLALTVYASPRVEGILEVWREARLSGADALSPEAGAIVAASTAAREALFLEGAKKGLTPEAPALVRHFRAWLSVVIPADDPKDERVLAEARLCRESTASILKQSHLYGREWTLWDFTATAGELLNPQKVRAGRWSPRIPSPFEEPRWQLVDRDAEITIGRREVRFACEDPEVEPVEAVGLSIESYPRRIDLVKTSLLLGEPGRAGGQIPCPFAFTAWVQIPNAAAEKLKIAARRVRARQMAETPIGAMTPHFAELHRELQIALSSFASEGGVAPVLHQMVLFAPAGRRAECVQSAQALARKASIDLQCAHALHGQALLSILPMAAGPLLAADAKKLKRMTTRTLATALHALPVMTEYRGTGPRIGSSRRMPLLLLAGRKGQLSLVDPFANPSGSYSMTVVGKPGSGKSVVMNELAMTTLAQGGRVWVIDVGGSYRKLARLLGGQYLELTDEGHWDLNPFAMAGSLLGEAAREEAEMAARVIMEAMTASGLDDYSASILTNLVHELLAAKGADARMDDLHEKLLHLRRPSGEPEPRGIELASMLGPYVSSGPLGKFFDGSGARINFRDRFTVLELEGLSQHRLLRSSVLLSLMLSIERAMETLPRDVPKLVIIDEAWDLMGEGNAGRFIEAGYRRARKLNGAFATATQSVADYWKSETAAAAWRCADMRIFLRQDAEGLDALARDGKLAADPWLRAAVGSLTTVAGAWSEMVVKAGDHPAAIGRLILDPFSRVAYSTLPAEIAAVERWRAAGLTTAEAIREVAAGRLHPEERTR